MTLNLHDPVTRRPLDLGTRAYSDALFRMRSQAERDMDEALAQYRGDRCFITRSNALEAIDAYKRVRREYHIAWTTYCATREEIRRAA